MTVTDTTARSQTEAISFEFDLQHPPEKVWRALTDPALFQAGVPTFGICTAPPPPLMPPALPTPPAPWN